jgi:NAD-dependent deacetylase
MAAPSDHEALAAMLLGTRNVVALTGLALGRDEDLEATAARSDWAQRASLEALLTEPAAFWDYYFPAARAVAGREPGPAHRALARLQAAGLIHHIVTQASDRLHTKAGAADVVEVHGNVLSARCERCGERYAMSEVGHLIAAAADGVPRCTTPGCGYPLRPSGTLWNEPLHPDGVQRAWDLAGEADVFMVFDSSLRTIPISLLPSVPLTREVPLAIVGRVPTQYDRYAQVRVTGPAEPVLVALADMLCPDTPPPG